MIPRSTTTSRVADIITTHPSSAARRSQRPGCGHDPYHRGATVAAVKPAGDLTTNTAGFLLRSLVGGRRELSSEPCPICRTQAVFRHRSDAGEPAVDIGTDVAIIRAALHVILDQSDVEVFTLVVTSAENHGDTSYVLPRHHMCAFRISN